MKYMLSLSIAAVAFVAALPARSQEEKSRAEVRAVTAEAIRTGNLPVGDEGHTANQIAPRKYGARPVVDGETRAQVKADTARARRLGEIPVGELDRAPREITPGRYPPAAAAPGVSRAEIKAETREAIQEGALSIGDGNRELAEQNPRRYGVAPAPRMPAKRSGGGAPASSAALRGE